MKEQLINQITDALVRSSKNLTEDSPKFAALASAIAESQAYAPTSDGLQPVNREAIKLLASQGVPASFIKLVAHEHAAKIEHPAQRTLALFEALGTSFDDSIAAEQNRVSGQ